MSNKHAYHIVDCSPWPLINSVNVLNAMISSLVYFKFPSTESMTFMTLATFTILMSMALWWRDICREGSLQGHHTYKVYTGLKISMLMFITSEIMFFFSFFWAFFHFSLAPEFEVSSNWPPIPILMVNPYHLPLLNSIILISSGASVTWCHYSILNKKLGSSLFSLFMTIVLGAIFTYIQAMEYKNMTFSLNDGVFGSTFFMLTGFHGFHVLVGTIFLSVNLIRIYLSQINNKHHFSLEAAAWYWHFVDVVWIYLYIFLYWWWFYSY